MRRRRCWVGARSDGACNPKKPGVGERDSPTFGPHGSPKGPSLKESERILIDLFYCPTRFPSSLRGLFIWVEAAGSPFPLQCFSPLGSPQIFLFSPPLSRPIFCLLFPSIRDREIFSFLAREKFVFQWENMQCEHKYKASGYEPTAETRIISLKY